MSLGHVWKIIIKVSVRKEENKKVDVGVGLLDALRETRVMKTYFISLLQFPLGTSTQKMYSMLSWYFEALLMKALYSIQ